MATWWKRKKHAGYLASVACVILHWSHAIYAGQSSYLFLFHHVFIVGQSSNKFYSPYIQIILLEIARNGGWQLSCLRELHATVARKLARNIKARNFVTPDYKLLRKWPLLSEATKNRRYSYNHGYKISIATIVRYTTFLYELMECSFAIAAAYPLSSLWSAIRIVYLQNCSKQLANSLVACN